MNDILFADMDSASVEAAVLTSYETIARTTLYPGDPVRLFLESLAFVIALQNNVINMAGRQNLLACAQGDHLDTLGTMMDTARLGASRAVATQRFSLASALDFAVTIPAGTRVTSSDGGAVFTTDSVISIPAGNLAAEGPITAAVPGMNANGLVPGQICRLIDPLPYVGATVNATTSRLGADRETDERYRTRIQLAPERFSCAGPSGAYRAHALAAHQDIADVAVWSPVPGTVDVRPVLAGGELPTSAVLEAVRRVLSVDDVRPLTDTVTVQAPEIVPYELRLTWFLAETQEALLSTTQARVSAAVEQYRVWQRTRPGRDILPLKLTSLLEQAGVRRVALASPAYRELEPWQLARESVVSVTYGGLERE